MKKLLALCLLLTSAAVAFAQRPLLVGHRGSSYGVENTVESFTNGAKLGYEYLETDFKVTKDLKLVCTHDDDLSRLGDTTLTIAGSTLQQLQAVPLTQTRLGTTYTGRLCSAQEYLDVCKQYDVRPLIELKWATGINSNDCSNIPLLIKLIEDNGFRNKCIILTSMKPCLEYIRKNYPDIELQFLTGQYWANHFGWCVEQGIDVDIQSGFFDKSTVQKYHDVGLKVNMWTANTNDNYTMYGNMGCDFITTDNLDPKTLPDLDPSILFPPNTVDYPNNSLPVRGFYNAELTAQNTLPAQLAGKTVKKAIIDGDSWVILATDGTTTDIVRVDALTGTVTGTYDTTGTTAICDIAMSADKVLAGIDSHAAGQPANIYTWANTNAAPAQTYALENTGDTELLAVSGRTKDIKVYIGVHDTATGAVSVTCIQLQNGQTVIDTATAKSDIVCTDEQWVATTMAVTPSSRDCLIIDTPQAQPVEYKFGRNATDTTLTVFATFADGLIPDALTGVSFHRRSAKVYAALPQGPDFGVTVFDITGGIADANPVTDLLTVENTDAATYIATGMSVVGDKLYTHVLAAPAYMASFAMNAENTAAEPKDIDPEFTLDWIYSESTSNKPDHIDGTNAQQGTAVNGLFYINDCSDKKIHIFDKNGYLGNIPGGAGWGCARDDAGNIIVRDDKLTGTTHNFIIYPAGATPDYYEDAIKLTAEVSIAGQTNFINAGGNLLGGTGHIYMYPNKQNAVNIITVTKGVVKRCTTAVDLAIAGTAAGYVVPLDDDPENWIYQVRNSGVYFYNGGTNSPVMSGRTSTTQPARNSTGGLAYFTLAGNNILVHNSGTNYVGGFTVRNLSAGDTDAKQVIKNISPIGTMGYKTGGNYSTFNWLIPEKVSDTEYALYQYCPANGIAKYTLRDKNSGVNNVLNDADLTLWDVNADHNTLSISGIEVAKLRVFNIAGILVASAYTDTVDISALAPGMYIVTVNDNASKKFVKK